MTIALIIIIILAALCCLLVYRNMLNDRHLAQANDNASRAAMTEATLRQENARLEERLTAAAELQRRTEADMNARLAEAAEAQRRTEAEMQTRLAEAEERAQRDARKDEEASRQADARFRVMAHEIMTQQTEGLRKQNEQHLVQLLDPLKSDIERFQKQVVECYTNESRERFSLKEQIQSLIMANQSIGREAKELSTALRGNSKIQGDWGELVLETILEKSGLREGEEFTVQQTTGADGRTLVSEDGHKLRPDVVVHYPGDRSMVIDSKVSLSAFVEYVNADCEESRKGAADRHLTSVRRHIDELSRKSYQDYVGVEKLDFVMMFIPNEGAYAAAMTFDPALWQTAYDKKVLIVSPTQLVGSLRLISQLWRHDRQTRNAIEIAQRSGAMYDKFVSFVDDMLHIEKGIIATHSAYQSALKKLSEGTGNLVNRAEQLRKLGLKTSKTLPDRLITSDDTEACE